jgi:hypothetical protein
VFTGPVRVALAAARLARVSTNGDLHRALSCRADAHMGMGEYEVAERMYRDVLAATTAIYGPTHTVTVGSMGKLASALWHREKHVESEALRRKVLSLRALALGEEHPVTLIGSSDLALSLSTAGRDAERSEEAERIFVSVIAAQKRVLGKEHAYTLVTMSNYASMLSRRGENAAAERVYRETVASQRRVLGDEHPCTMIMDSNLAACLAKQGPSEKRDEANAIYGRVIPLMREVLGPGHPDTVRVVALAST